MNDIGCSMSYDHNIQMPKNINCLGMEVFWNLGHFSCGACLYFRISLLEVL